MDRQDKEIASALYHFYRSLIPYSPANEYKNFLYNMESEHVTASFNQNPIRPISGTNQSYRMSNEIWTESSSKNPDVKRFYAIQINSPEELAARSEQNVNVSSSILGSLVKWDTECKDIEGKIKTEMSEKTEKLREEFHKLNTRFFSILSKLENFGNERRRVVRDSAAEIKINDSINSLNKRLQISRNIENMQVVHHDYGNLELQNERLDIVLNTLKKQRESLVGILNKSKQSYSQIQSLEDAVSRISSTPSQ